jgi:hypothetical protein
MIVGFGDLSLRENGRLLMVAIFTIPQCKIKRRQGIKGNLEERNQ